MTTGILNRLAPTLVTALLAMAALMPATASLSEHPDEAQYLWSASYFGAKVGRLDFDLGSGADFADPGWSPQAYWSQTQPMGTRFLYAAALAFSGTPGPALPYSYTDPSLQGPETLSPPSALGVARTVGVLAAATGLALMSFRLGWAGALATMAFLLLPHVRHDLARAWAEGPLMLGFGLCVATWKTRWFPVMCGVAASFKLTALGLWPLALWPRWNGGIRPALGFVLMSGVWTLLTPPSWFLGGPAFLAVMIVQRHVEYVIQSAAYPVVAGLHLPSHYLLPIKIAACELCAVLVVQEAWKWSAAKSMRRVFLGWVQAGARSVISFRRLPPMMATLVEKKTQLHGQE